MTSQFALQSYGVLLFQGKMVCPKLRHSTYCDCAVVCSADEEVNRLALGLTTHYLADGDDV